MLISAYNAIKKNTDKEYGLPSSNSDILYQNFKNVRWKNQKIKNFLAIMKIIAEKGSCTAHEIAKFDDYSKRKKDLIKRQKIYSRIIEGSRTDKVPGLISKRLVKQSGSIMTSKPTKKYRLTIFGILYIFHIFSCFKKRKKDNETKSDPLIKDIVESYSDQLPLIFGKWNFLKNNSFDLFVLEKFANSGNPYINLMEGDPLIDEFANRGMQTFPEDIDDYIEPEINMVFFSNQFKDMLKPNVTLKRLKKDKDIYDYYSNFLATLEAFHKQWVFVIKGLRKNFT